MSARFPLTFALDLPPEAALTLAWGALRLRLEASPGALKVWSFYAEPVAQPRLETALEASGGEPLRLARLDSTPLSAEVCVPSLPLLLRFVPSLVLAPHAEAHLTPTLPLAVRLKSGAVPLGEWSAHPVRRAWVGPDTRHGELGWAPEAGLAAGAPLSAPGRLSASNHGKERITLSSLAYPVQRLGLGGSAEAPRWGAVRWSFEAPGRGRLQLDPPPNNPLLPAPFSSDGAYWNLIPSRWKR